MKLFFLGGGGGGGVVVLFGGWTNNNSILNKKIGKFEGKGLMIGIYIII